MVTPMRLSAAKPEVAEPKPIAKATALNTDVFFHKKRSYVEKRDFYC